MKPTKRKVPFHTTGATAYIGRCFLRIYIKIMPPPANKNPRACTGKNIAFKGSKSQIFAAYNNLYVAFKNPAIKTLIEPAANKEKDALSDMRIVQEMYARGFEFEPIDIFRAQSRLFQIVDGKIMPSLSSIDGLGEKAADAIVEAAKKGAFLSKDDFRERTKVSSR